MAQHGILLVAFGSGSLQGDTTLRRFEKQVREIFPEASVRWAFTSHLMRERLADAWKKSDSVRKALDKMAFERMAHVAVQPLHVIPGREYSELVAEVSRLREERLFTSLALGQPLLTETPGSVERMAQALLHWHPSARDDASGAVPSETIRRAVVFMGHGSRCGADSMYAMLAQKAIEFSKHTGDIPVFIGTLNGEPGLETLLPHLQRLVPCHVWLMPLLSVAGRHSLEDMAGSGEHSWRSRIEAAGISCTPIVRGLIESPEVSAIWIERLQEAIRREKG